MPQRRSRTPAYRYHTHSGQAVVRLNGKDFYLGRFGSPASRSEYDRLIAEWLTNGRTLPTERDPQPDGLSVDELIVRFLEHARTYYRKGGQPTGEYDNFRYALRPLQQLYGDSQAIAFGPSAWKAVRQAMIDAGLCRPEINRRMGRILRLFKWAVENELVLPTVVEALRCVPGLRRGRSEAREPEKIQPVPEPHIEAIRPRVAPQVWAMVQLQWLTGMRPGEVVLMRPCHISRSVGIWDYRPETHKTEHHGRERVILLGPRAQEILTAWMDREPGVYLFSPSEAREARFVQMRAARKTPVPPSQVDRSVRSLKRVPRDHYTVASYRRAIHYGCDRAGIPQWSPHQLRHNAATRIRLEFGLDAARAILGHSSPVVTEIYAELDRERALEVISRVG